jgi:hypothetical protein
MVNDFVHISGAESVVGHERIGVDRSFIFDVLHDFTLNRMLAAIGYDSGADFTTAFKDSENGSLVFAPRRTNPASMLFSVHVNRFAADKSFVGFNLFAFAAKLTERDGLHGETDSVKHEPCGLLRNAKSAAQFVGADSVLAVRNHPDRNEPLIQTEGGILKDGSDFGAELFASMSGLAFPQAASPKEADFLAPASGAGDAIGPAPSHHEFQAVVGIGEIYDGLLECLWLVHGVPSHVPFTEQAYQKSLTESSILLPSYVWQMQELKLNVFTLLNLLS